MANPWTDAAIAELRRLWADDLSASQIANELNRQFKDRTYTRNSVIGYSHRLPLPDRTKSGRNTRRTPLPRIAPPAPVAPKPTTQPGKPPAPALRCVSVQPAPIPRPAYPIPATGLTLDEAQSARGCLWALGERPFRFCGKPGDPYCPDHVNKSRDPKQKPGVRISTNRNSRLTS